MSEFQKLYLYFQNMTYNIHVQHFTKTSAHAKCFPIQWYVYCLPGWTVHVNNAQTNPNRVTNWHTHKRTKKIQNTHALTKLRHLKCQHVSMIPCSWVETTAWGTPNRKENHNTVSITCHLPLKSLQVRPLASQWISPGIHQSASLLEEDWCSCFLPLLLEVLRLFRRSAHTHTHPAEAGWEYASYTTKCPGTILKVG